MNNTAKAYCPVKIPGQGYDILTGDVLEKLSELPNQSFRCCVTSPPYWGLRDYDNANQLGQEETPEKYVANMVKVFHELRRVMRNDSTLWLNIGDTYRDKQLVGIPWRLAFALQRDGWILRQDIIWSKPDPMPDGVKDRCTKSHEYIFLLCKSPTYYYDDKAVSMKALHPGKRLGVSNKKTLSLASIGTRNEKAERGLLVNGDTINRRSVWSVSGSGFSGEHFAPFPEKLIEPCILAGSAKGDIIFDPFLGSGTTIITALKNYRKGFGIELNPDYVKLAKARIMKEYHNWLMK